ncbi:MAG TPA: tetratricopeptide repeat protein [Spirochaetales bacterium]|nr:tetratricopeptide repeat protein [Spirochaetales bacterium]HPB65712.1 tetratricopeptide repeat protein [Spirochaetales bacterium]HPG86186.1 tetratricopeptide repeat protein [Spirochaetales bacterium]
MSFVIILIVFFGIAVGVLSFFLIRLIVMPKRLSAVAELIKQGRYQAATKAVKSMLAKEPRNAAAHYYLGKIYLAEGKPELALMEFKTVGDIGQFGHEIPETEFRRLIADLYERFGQLEEALKEYILLAKGDPRNAEYFYQCSRIFDERGKADVATKYARKAVELDPRHGKAHYMLGVILYKTKHPLEAKAEFELGLKFDPSNYDSYYYLGKLMKESNDYTGALLAFERAQKSPALKIKALVERGGTYMSQGSYDNAAIELERAVKLAKDDGSSESLYGRYFLSLCYEKMKNIDKAIEQWEKIYAKKPQFRDVAEKLTQYQEYRTDDRIKDYLTCGQDDFIELCKLTAMNGLNLAVRDVIPTPNGVDFITVENESDKWLGTKKMPRLLRFLRVSEQLDDSSIRSLLDNMKKLGIIRGVIVTSSGFNRSAIEFAENRSVELYHKEQLQELLKKASASS